MLEARISVDTAFTDGKAANSSSKLLRARRNMQPMALESIRQTIWVLDVPLWAAGVTRAHEDELAALARTPNILRTCNNERLRDQERQ